jgi:hypothetical protein
MTTVRQDSTEEALRPKIFLPKHPTQVEPETGLRNCVAYCAQSPWLEHLSIKDNISFGSPFDQERYNQVIEACALKPDLSIFEDGDATEIGARWVTLIVDAISTLIKFHVQGRIAFGWTKGAVSHVLNSSGLHLILS